MDCAVKHYDRSHHVYDYLMTIFGTAPSTRKFLMDLDLKISKKAHILDLGCGTGLSTDVLSSRFPEAIITGMDYSKCMLRKYGKRFPSSRLFCGNFNEPETIIDIRTGKNMKLSKESFDLVVSTFAVAEYGDMTIVLPWVHEILKRKGTFLCLGVKDKPLNRISSHVWKFKPTGEDEYMKECKRTGFKTKKEKMGWDYFPSNITKYAVKATKK
jgi:ubiquinone/menaquinone biosynthesis C-methylase UbiE